MRIGANQKVALLLLATGPAPSTGELCAEIERQGDCGTDTAQKGVWRLLRGGLVRRLPGRGSAGSWGALALTASGRRYLAHRRTWWERKYGAPERPEEWGRSSPEALRTSPLEAEWGPEREPAAVELVDEPPRCFRGARSSGPAPLSPRREGSPRPSSGREVDPEIHAALDASYAAQVRMLQGERRVNGVAQPSGPLIARRAGGVGACPSCGAPLEPMPGAAARELRQARCPRCWSVWQGR